MLLLFGVMGGLEPITTDSEWEAGDRELVANQSRDTSRKRAKTKVMWLLTYNEGVVGHSPYMRGLNSHLVTLLQLAREWTEYAVKTMARLMGWFHVFLGGFFGHESLLVPGWSVLSLHESGLWYRDAVQQPNSKWMLEEPILQPSAVLTSIHTRD